MIQKFLLLWYKKSWVKSLGFVKDDRTWNFSHRQWMWVLSGFSIGIWFIKFILPLFWVIIFVFKSRIFGMRKHFFYFSDFFFSFLKTEITKEKRTNDNALDKSRHDYFVMPRQLNIFVLVVCRGNIQLSKHALHFPVQI